MCRTLIQARREWRRGSLSPEEREHWSVANTSLVLYEI
jgi:hypothetical protein